MVVGNGLNERTLRLVDLKDVHNSMVLFLVATQTESKFQHRQFQHKQKPFITVHPLYCLKTDKLRDSKTLKTDKSTKNYRAIELPYNFPVFPQFIAHLVKAR